MQHDRIQLDYEKPDDTRPARDVSPFAQTLLGYATFSAITVLAVAANVFLDRPGTITIAALILAVSLSIIAHYGLRWHEFAPAMGVALAVLLFILAIVGIGWFVMKML